MTEASPLGPINPDAITDVGQQTTETEAKAPWIVRKLVGVSTELWSGTYKQSDLNVL